MFSLSLFFFYGERMAACARRVETLRHVETVYPSIGKEEEGQNEETERESFFSLRFCLNGEALYG